ncbi:hypothetical protein GOBAR_DD29559 [Gossypium barbadense]|nr:hypothetical protein GOBAR_DD29559 [Gossypium barbadense]
MEEGWHIMTPTADVNWSLYKNDCMIKDVWKKHDEASPKLMMKSKGTHETNPPLAHLRRCPMCATTQPRTPLLRASLHACPSPSAPHASVTSIVPIPCKETKQKQ